MDNPLTKESFKNGFENSEELLELRSLLLDIEPSKVNKLYESLDNLEVKAEDISKILPEAVILSSQKEEYLSSAMVSTVEKAIHESVSNDLNILTKAIFPIIGPAIRKAVATAFDDMLQSMNQALEHSLSLKSFQWRLEAQRTGKSFAEIVLLRTLIYRVEQVFLIHQNNGLLLNHIVAPQVSTQDPELVSGMLSAIQDFVHDSFQTNKQDILQSMDFGDLSIWIETGPSAILAAIIRGNAPQDLRLVLQNSIEKIHLKFDRELHNFDGDTESFEDTKPYLEDCLQSKYKPRGKKNYTFAWFFLSGIAIAIAILSFFAIRERLRWEKFVHKLDSQPGIRVVNYGRRANKYYVLGMRDPLAIHPQRLIEQNNLKPEQVNFEWESYTSHESEFLLKRTIEILQPPKTVSIDVDKSGSVVVSGSAPRKWILSARNSWRFIPGIINFRENNLVEIEISKLDNYKQQVEKTVLFFIEKTTNLSPKQDKKLENLAINVQKLIDTSRLINREIFIEVIGHSNKLGTAKVNKIISQKRGEKILNYLKSRDINPRNMAAVGVGYQQPLKIGSKRNNQNKLGVVETRVTFKVFLDRE
ncbi:MAG: OmpA family protein [Cyanobacteria bacterium P01_A01_bin.45]